MNSEAIASALDPERKRAGWFTPRWSIDCKSELQQHVQRYTGPALAEDDLAAMQYVVPVLSKCGLLIEIYPYGAYVRRDVSTTDMYGQCWECISGGDADDGAPIALAPACAAAVAWLLEHEPGRWEAAVGEVGHAK